MVGVAQLVRASDCGSEGRGFESHHPPQKIPVHKNGNFFIQTAGLAYHHALACISSAPRSCISSLVRVHFPRFDDIQIHLAKNPRSQEREFFYPNRRFGISSRFSVYLISSKELYIITRKSAFSSGLMICNSLRN